jgi:hypothetical protein
MPEPEIPHGQESKIGSTAPRLEEGRFGEWSGAAARLLEIRFSLR